MRNNLVVGLAAFSVFGCLIAACSGGGTIAPSFVDPGDTDASASTLTDATTGDAKGDAKDASSSDAKKA